jgi:hypothetical protein
MIWREFFGWATMARDRRTAIVTIPDHMSYPADHTPVIHARNATRPGEKGFNALKLSLSQPELIRHRQVLLPRLNHDVTPDGIRVCKGLLCGQTGHGTGSSSISVSLP